MTAESGGQRKRADDRTIYWTQSFYIPVDSDHFAPKLGGRSDEFVAWLRGGGARHAASGTGTTTLRIDDRTQALRQAIDPLFNDVADRSRLGKVEDFLFAGQEVRDVTLTLPRRIEWMTEGKTFVITLPDAPRDRARHFDFRSFWYVYGNGSLSWHAGFSHCYADELKAELQGGVPVSYYLMSLLQKLAWPKEFDPAAAARDCEDGHCTTDALVKIEIDGMAFWEFLKAQFDEDAKTLLPRIYEPFDWAMPAPTPGKESLFDKLVQTSDSVEVPGLRCPDSRSCFFIHDKQFFDLIQPRESGALVGRASRVLDDNFIGYPGLIDTIPVRGGKRHLDKAYWASVYTEIAGAGPGTRRPKRGAPSAATAKRASGLPDAAERVTYLFLAGFNQNIIDFMNQEASEILDSLDPIYPKSEEQEAEGFFIRYANPRSMITYVPRSRTLEVGNDFIGTCPYAFLIHVLSMHNEVLTREQEKATFLAIRKVMERLDAVREAEKPPVAPGRPGDRPTASDSAAALAEAEALINSTRIDAFRKFDQHRYANPFRYDTEHDVFEAMERLRGTSRLKEAYQSALDALDEQTRDIHRIRKERDQDDSASRERRISYIFGFLGFTGIASLILATDEFLRNHVTLPVEHISQLGGVGLALSYWLAPAALIGLAIHMSIPTKK